ncbi:hypothetical protein AB0G15_12745 [Streptosporangium sp. NPDC023825]|uniref:hypothetical protein n=1 Tax=Streptosporangium sp. NPDC023825 TaxID=3154909 RepID=UPI00342D2EAF
MLRTVRSLADRLLESLVPGTRAQAMACVEGWQEYTCPPVGGAPYPTRSLRRVRTCNGVTQVLETLPCGTAICGGNSSPYGPFVPLHPCPPPSCPPFMMC